MKNNIARRNFLKTIGAGTAFLASTSALYGINAFTKANEISNKNLFELFQNPPAGAKPFYRWWWNGNRITTEEVKRELEIMKEAGAGGVEINPIALNPAVKNPSAEALTWLSDEWIEVLKAAIEKGDELGMISDMIVEQAGRLEENFWRMRKPFRDMIFLPKRLRDQHHTPLMKQT